MKLLQNMDDCLTICQYKTKESKDIQISTLICLEV